MPAWRRATARARPVGPAPTIRTSVEVGSMGRLLLSTCVDFLRGADCVCQHSLINARSWNDAAKKPGKSDRTRAAILEAARELFATEGYERATVRDIAAKAAIDPALVIRYFGSKEALFVRAADIELRMPDLARGARLARRGDRAALPLDLGGRGRQSRDDDPAALGGVEPGRGGEAAGGLRADRCCRRSGAGGGDPPGGPGWSAASCSASRSAATCFELPPVVAMPVERIVREVGATVQRYLDG